MKDDEENSSIILHSPESTVIGGLLVFPGRGKSLVLLPRFEED